MCKIFSLQKNDNLNIMKVQSKYWQYVILGPWLGGRVWLGIIHDNAGDS